MELIINRAGQDEIAYIQEKLQKYILDSTNICWSHFFVAKIEKKIVGFGRIIDHGGYFEIASLGVDYYHRKKGIGKKMMLFLVQTAKASNPQKPLYGVTHLKDFLTKCGFVEVEKEFPDYLEYKRKFICRLDQSQISIMRWPS